MPKHLAAPEVPGSKAALQSLGVWDSVAGSVAEAENVRAAPALVSRGEASLGIVYTTAPRPLDCAQSARRCRLG